MHLLETLEFTNRVAKRAQYEAFEFTVVPDGVVVRNCSHEDPSEHEYTVTVTDGVPMACDCPADRRYVGACKHRVAVAIREPVMAAAAATAIAADGGSVSSESGDDVVEADEEAVPECDCGELADGFPCWECVRAGRRDLSE